MSGEAAPRDYAHWKQDVRQWSSVGDFGAGLTGTDATGIHSVRMADGEDLDILVWGDPREVEGGLPVFLNGAVPGRGEKRGPFFSGGRVGPKVAKAYVSVSDPSVDRSGQVSLAWYAGNEYAPVTETLADALRAMSAAWGKELVLVGGSGGGFASLKLGTHLGERCSLFLWNAQTDILAYSKVFVDAYLTHSFPTTFPHGVEDAGWKDEYRGRAAATGPCLSVVGGPEAAAAPRRILYLQNRTDWHLQAHAFPFLSSGGFRGLGRGTFLTDDQHVLQVAEWGDGHEPLSTELVIDHLTHFLQPGALALDVARSVLADERVRAGAADRAPLDLRPISADIRAQVRPSWDAADSALCLDLGRVPTGYGGLRFAVRRRTEAGERQIAAPQEDPRFLLPDHGRVPGAALTVEAWDGFGHRLFDLPVPSPARSPRIFVYGSCVSRDAFEFDHEFEIAEYVARSPLVSAFAPPPASRPAGADLARIDSSFQRRMVTWDWEKELPRLLHDVAHDHLLVDLIDERIPLFRHGGSVVAYSVEAQRSGLTARPEELWDAHADDYLDHWRRALEQLLATEPADRIIVNEAYWAAKDSRGNDLSGRFPVQWANSVLEAFYASLRDVPGVRFITYDPELLTADADHRWGLSPFHFVDDFYRHFLRQLDTVTHEHLPQS